MLVNNMVLGDAQDPLILPLNLRKGGILVLKMQLINAEGSLQPNPEPWHPTRRIFYLI